MPHSILKKTTPLPPTASSDRRPHSREDRNMETALYHAELLRQRKEVEAQIFASLEVLLDLPSSPSADATRPSSADSALVKKSLRPFQPSDYDALVEERNISKQCGYVLCPRPNRQEDTKAKYRILQKGGKGRNGLKIVETHTLERWCSDDCGKRALYVKVQMNEEPAWSRTNTMADVVLLIDEPECGRGQNGENGLIERLKNLEIGQPEDKVIAQMKALSVERGDGIALSRSLGLADVQENATANCQAPTSSYGTTEAVVSNAIEGYVPKFAGKKHQRKDDDDEDMMDTI